jgi:SAM-dependent methyltransferase
VPATPDPGSFRDPESRVLLAGDEVLRALSSEGLADFMALRESGLLEDPRIVRTDVVSERPSELSGLAFEAAAVLRHERIPFVSYPYEWSFSMLKDAALLQLDLLQSAVEHQLMLKDATPYNVQYLGARPVFIDVGSFERLHEEELWVGYRQFCMLYLFPLLLQAHKGMDFHPLLRGSVDGIDAGQVRALMSSRDRLRRGYFTHVVLQARLERRAGTAGGQGRINAALKRPGLGTQLIATNVRKMHRLVSRLQWTPVSGTWLGYAAHNTYSEDDNARKDTFVRTVSADLRPQLVWDLGCNTGRHSRIASESAEYVVAMDADPGPIELLYRSLREEGETKILPLTVNLTDPSPGLGWRGRERKPLLDRGRPDLVLALAVLHHLVIGGNVPMAEVVDWLADLGAALVVEFPTREDPMVQALLARKPRTPHADYDRANFEHCLASAFDVRRSEELASGTRVLYFVTPRGRRSTTAGPSVVTTRNGLDGGSHH